MTIRLFLAIKTKAYAKVNRHQVPESNRQVKN